MTLKQRTYSFLLILSALAVGLLLILNSLSLDDASVQSKEKGQRNNSEVHSIPQEQVNSQQKQQTTSENEFLTESLTTRLLEVAQRYEKQTRYPHFSTPVIDPELAKTPAPFEEARVYSATFDEQGQPLALSLSASTNKLDYGSGEQIIIQLIVNGIESVSGVFASAEIKQVDSKETAHNRFKLLPTNSQLNELRANVDSSLLKTQGGAQEFLAVIRIEVDGREHLTTVPFTVSELSAELIDVAGYEQNDEYLEISLDFEVHQSGYYFVHAYLDDASTLEPLLVLQSEGKMSAGSDQLTLRAHHQALKDAGSQGPYSLRVVRAFRGAEPEESNDVIASVSKDSFAIPDFNFNGYTNMPYQNDMNKRRIEALRALASSD